MIGAKLESFIKTAALWCIESDFFGTSDPEVILASVLPYMIVPDSKPGSIGISVGVVMLGIGLILLLIAIVRIKKAKHTPAAQTSEDGASPYFDAQAPAASTNSSKFCPHCGTPLEDNAHFCPSCGAKVNGGDRFCSGCGQKLS